MMANSTDIELLQSGETILGRYTIAEHLGSGGQGQVYLARHRIFDQVAVKRLHPHIAAKAEGLARFERELRITDQLRGEHVILIRSFDNDLARDEWFSVMEYANGGSLKDKLAIEAPLPIAEAADLTINLCQVLAHIHEYPYVHGDLKPSNILFHTTPSGRRILKLSDFGSAFQPIRAGVLPLPPGLKEARTMMYVSPELLDASDPEDTEALKVDVDRRADIYSVGVILYEMLTGRPPFWEPFGESEDLMVRLEREHAVLRKVKEQLPPEPKRQRSEILPSLNALVMKALAKDPADRFANVDEMQVRLKEILHEEKARLAELARLRPLADQALQEKQWGQASDLLYKILNLDPGDQDALEKLGIAEDQQRLMSLRLQKIPRAMNEELWEEARKLVEEALAIEPDDAELKAYQIKIANQLTIAELLAQAREAESKENWRKAINLCLEAIRLDPNHAEASSLLDHTRRQLKIAALRQEAETLRQQGDKQGELEKLEKLQEVVPTDQEVNTRIKELQKAIDLETYYAQGKQAYDEKRWKAAVEALKKVIDLDKFYLDAASILLDAQEWLAEELSAKRDAERRRELLIWLEFRRRVSDAWQQTVKAARTWKGVLAIVGVLLTFIVLPVLTAEDDTPLGRIRGKIVAHVSTMSPIPTGTPSPTNIPTLTLTATPTRTPSTAPFPAASPSTATPTATHTTTWTPTSTATLTPTEEPTVEPTEEPVPVPPTATATDTPTPPAPTPTSTAIPPPTVPLTLTIYLRDTRKEPGFAALSGDQPNGGMIYEEGRFVYGEAAVQIGATIYHFDKEEVEPGEPEQLPDPWRVEFEFAEALVARTGNQAGFNAKKAQFWVGRLDSHSAVGEDNPYSLTMKLYEGNELRESIQVFFTVADAPVPGLPPVEPGGGGKPTPT